MKKQRRRLCSLLLAVCMAFGTVAGGVPGSSPRIVYAQEEEATPRITPEAVNTAAGETVVLKAEAEGEGLTYQWQYSKNGGSTWTNCKSGGAKTDTFSFTMAESLAGRLYRCQVTDAAGNVSLTSEVPISLPLTITSQPADVSAAAGETVSFSVEASGTELAYQWQYSKNGGSTWTNCSSGTYNTDTFSFAMKESLAGRLYRCEVTGGGSSVISRAALVSLKGDEPEILTQPADVMAAAGETVTFTVKAAGADLAYQWQYSTDGGVKWRNCGSGTYNTDAFSFAMKESLAGRLYRCEVTGSGEITVFSEAALVSLRTEEFAILTQPADVTAAAGETVTFTVEAAGTDLVYQWQYSTNGGSSWKNCGSTGYNTSSFSFAMKESLSGRLYRCRVSSGSLTLESNAAAVTLEAAPEADRVSILTQPADVSAAAGDLVVLSVTAEGNGVLSYQWQYSANGGSSWKNCSSGGYNTAAFSFQMKDTLDGRQYRCRVSCGEAEEISAAALISLKEEEPIVILTQPQDVSVREGETVRFAVSASGPELSYQWQYSSNGGTSWRNCGSTGYNTSEFSFVMKAGLSGRMYRCIVKNEKEEVISEAGTVTLNENHSLSLTASFYTIVYNPNDEVLPVLTLENVPEGETVFWSSSDISLLRVNNQGVLSLWNAYSRDTDSTVTITAEAGGSSASVDLTFTKEGLFDIYPAPEDGLYLLEDDVKSISRGRGGQIHLLANSSLSGSIVWSNSNPELVDMSVLVGLYNRVFVNPVKGGGTGTAWITATAGGQSYSTPVYVVAEGTEVPADSYRLMISGLTDRGYLVVGEEQRLYVSSRSFNPLQSEMDWTVSDPSVLRLERVEGEVVLSAMKEGTATITGSYHGVVSSLTLEVRDYEDPADLKITGFTQLFTDDYATLRIAGAAGGSLVWTSSDDEVIHINGSGTGYCDLRAGKPGRATITAWYQGRKQSTVIEVQESQESAFRIYELPEPVAVGAEGTAYTNADWESQVPVLFRSSDESVLSIRESGEWKAIAAGTAVITAVWGEKTAARQVTVKEEDDIPLKIYGGSFDRVVGYEGEDLYLQVSGPVNTMEKVTVTSSDESVASMMENNVMLVLHKAGQTTITVSYGSQTASLLVVVREKLEESTPSYHLNPSWSQLYLEDQERTKPRMYAFENLTGNEVQPDAWISSDTGIAEIDANGAVTAKAAGVVKIMAVFGEETVSREILIRSSAELPLRISDRSSSSSDAHILEEYPVLAGEELTLYAIGSQGMEVNWTSSDLSVMSVAVRDYDQSARITGLQEGTATLTLTAEDGRSASVRIHVYPVTEYPLILSFRGSMYENNTLWGTLQAMDMSRAAIFSSSDPSVCRVFPAGGNEFYIESYKAGSAVITAVNGERQASMTVTVTRRPLSIGLSDYGTKYAGEPFYVYASGGDQESDPVWRVSDESLATIEFDEERGETMVYPKKEGNLRITVTRGEDIASYSVYINPAENLQMRITDIPWYDSEASRISMRVDDTFNLYLEHPVYKGEVTWESTDPSILEVAESGSYGRFIVRGYGTVTITATSTDGTTMRTASVTLENYNEPLRFNFYDDWNSDSFYIGDQAFFDFRGSDTEELRLSSSDPSVIWVDTNDTWAGSFRKIVALKPGTAVLTAVAGEETASFTVTVKDAAEVPMELQGISHSVTISMDSWNLFMVRRYDEEAGVTVTVSDPAMAEVERYNRNDYDGVPLENCFALRTKAVGAVDLLITSGEKTVTWTVDIVKDPLYFDSLSPYADETYSIYAYSYLAPVTWTVSDPSMAEITGGDDWSGNRSFQNVHFLRPGTVTITIESDGETFAQEIVVRDDSSLPMQIEGVYDGESYWEMSARPLTVRHGVSGGSLTWSSSDETVARFENGTLIPVGNGTVTITAVSTDGSVTKEASITITLQNEPMGWYADWGTMEDIRYLDDSFTVYANSYNDTVSWESSNPEVLQILSSESWYTSLYAAAEGTSVLTATDGVDTLSVTIEVRDPANRPMEIQVYGLLDGNRWDVGSNSNEVYLSYYVEDSTITWTSSNEELLTITGYGDYAWMEPHGFGEVTITAVSVGAEKTKEASVTFEIFDEPLTIESVVDSSDTGRSWEEYDRGDESFLEDEVYRLMFRGRNHQHSDYLSAEVSNSDLADVWADGFYVYLRMKQAGNFTLTVQSVCDRWNDETGAYGTEVLETLTQEMTVLSDEGSSPVLVCEETSNRYPTELDVLHLRAAHLPEGVTVTGWSSSAPENATVDENGRVLFLACTYNEVIITASLSNGDNLSYVFYQISENGSMPSINIWANDMGEPWMYKGTTTGMWLDGKPSTWDFSDIQVSLSDPEVLSVAEVPGEKRWEITALSVGNCTITLAGPTKTMEYTMEVRERTLTITSDEIPSPLCEGMSFRLYAGYEDASMASFETVQAEWSSSDESIATVVDGYVQSLKEGEVDITARANGTEAVFHAIFAPLEISINGYSGEELSCGYTIGLYAQVMANGEDVTGSYTPTWESSNPDCAEIMNQYDGMLEPRNVGTAEITCRIGELASATITVTVAQREAELQVSSEILKVSEICEASFVYTDCWESADSDAIVWSSSDEAVVRVDEWGMCQPTGVGTAVITGTDTYGVTASVTLTVEPFDSYLEGDTRLFLGISDMIPLSFYQEWNGSYEPVNELDVTWQSSDPGIVSVSDGVMTAKSVGKVTISASAPFVMDAFLEVEVVTPTNVSLEVEADSDTMCPGDMAYLDLAGYYNETFCGYVIHEYITWSSSDESVATVDVNGILSFTGYGTVTITAEYDGLEPESVEFHVEYQPENPEGEEGASEGMN